MPVMFKDKIYEEVAIQLDISPSDFERARQRYMAVGNWLEDGDYACDSVEIYLQGSFRLGTVIRPYRNKSDTDYDIDQVCEINGDEISAKELKHDVGNRLKSNKEYARLLDEEGRRCWTINYPSAKNRPGFHLDVLPSKKEGLLSDSKIMITHRSDNNYVWRNSNPKGYYQWFKSKNPISEDFLNENKTLILARAREVYSRVQDIPKELIRTPLQRAIQIMKRHRDVLFDGKPNRPISIIITTICAHRYQQGSVDETIDRFVNYVKDRLETVVGGTDPVLDGILDFIEGKWQILNPTDDRENFADRWDLEPELARSFFSWVYQLSRDVDGFTKSHNAHDLKLAITGFQDHRDRASVSLIKSIKARTNEDLHEFLGLIHQGIEGQASWSDIMDIARDNVHKSEGKERDVSFVNYYQVKLHYGASLTEDEVGHIRQILRNQGSVPAFVLCCNILLGMATPAMLRDTILSNYGYDILSWPILRLWKMSNFKENRMILPYS